MKMMRQIKHTNHRLFNKVYLKIFGALLLMATFIFIFSISHSLRSFTANTLSPLFKTGNYFYNSLGWLPRFFADKNELIKENEKLYSEIENLYLNIIDYESLKYENQQLRDELKIKPTGKFLSAVILAKAPQIPSDSLFLNRGTEDGVRQGDLVLASQKILIGKIVEISKNKSTVALNSFAGVISYGFVARTKESLEIKGGGGGSLEIKVPADFDIVVGDKIIMGGTSNYLIAIVNVVEEKDSSGSKNVFLSLPTNISKLNLVFIESNTDE